MLFIRQQTRILFVLQLLLLGLFISPSWAISDVEIRKSPYDNRQYKGLYLDNGLRVLLVSDPSAEKAAAALNVQVGSFNENSDREGLAHFLEHMLFLGTKKYPNAGEYKTYINAHGGYHNAFTANRNTQYFFEVLPSGFEGALDRFAQFFISPMFNPELVDRERHAVNSEYQLSIKNDGNRIYEVDHLTANPQHPITQFSFGSIETLGDDPKRTPVREALLKFYADYYTAERMTLAVVSSQTLDELEKMVKLYFSPIAKHATKPNEIQALAFTNNETGKLISIQSLGDYQEMMITFPIPSQRDKYNIKAIDYILYLLKQSGPKSLYQLLKSKNWITDIGVNSNDLTYNQDIARISFSLTNEGMKHIDEIVHYTFEYIYFLKQTGPQAAIFDDLKLAGERNFIFSEKQSPVDYASALPAAMQHYPLEQVLVAGSFNKNSNYDPKAIQDLLGHFTARNMRLTVIAKDIKGDRREPKYNVSYSIVDFTPELLAKWNDVKDENIFALPDANQFMPKDFSALPKDSKLATVVPQQIVSKPGVEVWHKQDQTFGLPLQNMLFLLAAPETSDTAKQQLLFMLMQQVIGDKLNNLGTKFSLAGIAVSTSQDAGGLILNVSMFSDQQLIAIQEISKIIADAKIDPVKFNNYKADVVRNLQNFKQNMPFKQAIMLSDNLLYKNSWSSKELLAVSSNITLQDVEQFTLNFLQNIKIKALIHGNVSKETAIKIVDAMEQIIHVNTDFNSKAATAKLVLLKNGSKFNYSFDPNHNDSALVRYYQAQSTDDKTIAVNSLLIDLIDSPLYEQLRTKEQLGYVVGVRLLRTRQQAGMQFYIESVNRKPSYLNSRLADFATKFKFSLNRMQEKELETYKNSLSGRLLETPNSLTEETGRYWGQIVDGTYRFNFYQDIAKQVQTIVLKDVVEYYNDTWMNSKTQRTITVSTMDKKSATPKLQMISTISEFKAKQMYD